MYNPERKCDTGLKMKPAICAQPRTRRKKNVQKLDILTRDGITECGEHIPNEAGDYCQEKPKKGTEPPVLKPEVKRAVTVVKKDNEAIETNLEECRAKLESTKDNLKKTKAEIEGVNMEIIQLQNILDSCIPPDRKKSITNQKLLKHRELMALINREDKLTSDLDTARRAYAEANVQQQSQTLKMDKQQIELLESYEARKEFEYQRRVLREENMRQNAHIVRAKALKAWATTIQNRMKTSSGEGPAPCPTTKAKISKAAAKSLRQYRMKLIKKMEVEKAVASTEEHQRQTKQFENLSHLKHQLNKQRDNLWVEAEERYFRQQRRKRRREQMMNDLREAGENPYIVDRMLELEAQKRIQGKKTESTQYKVIKRVREEFLQRERAKEKQKRIRARWDRFWDAKAKQKRRMAILENRKYIDFEPEVSMPERIETAITSFMDEPTNKKAMEFYNIDLIMAEKGVTGWVPKAPVPVPVLPEPEFHKKKKKKMAKHGRRTSAESIASSRISHGKKLSASAESYDKAERFSHDSKEHRRDSSMSEGSREIEMEMRVSALLSDMNINIRGKSDTLIDARVHEAVKDVPDKYEDQKKMSITPAFKVLPEVVVFKDFDLGKIYKKKVMVLNRTTDRIKFYLRDFIDTGSKPDPLLELCVYEPEVISDSNSETDADEKHGDVDVIMESHDLDALDSMDMEQLKSFFRPKLPGEVETRPVTAVSTSKPVISTKSKSNQSVKLTAAKSNASGKSVAPTTSNRSMRPLTAAKSKPNSAFQTLEVDGEDCYYDETEGEYESDLSSSESDGEFPLITDLVKVDFKVPPMICPGLTHNFNLTFTPDRLGDWEGEIRFDSHVGPFSVPVKCLRKRFLPELSTSKVIFKNVIGGTNGCMSVTLKNKGGERGRISRFRIYDAKRNSVANHLSQRTDRLLTLPREYTGKETEDDWVSKARFADFVTRREMYDKVLEKRKANGVTDPVENDVRDFLGRIVNNAMENIIVLTVKERRRNLGPHEELTLQVHFHPPLAGHYANTFEIEFEEEETESLVLEVEGTTAENPVKANPMHTDLKICLMNMNYQQPISIFNGSKCHGRIIGQVADCMDDYAYVYPNEQYSPAGRSVVFSVKFRPRTTMTASKQLKGIYDPISKIIDFPVYFFLEYAFPSPGPLLCTVQAVLDEASLEINPPQIDMGKCLTTETVRKRFTLKNLSVVPQHFGVYEMPKYASVQPNNGFGTIFPNETIQLELLVSLAAHTIGDLHFPVKLKTMELGEYSIPVKCIGKTNKIQLSHCNICFPVTCVDSVSSTVIEIFSTAQPIKTRGHLTSLHGILSKFEFMLPHGTPIEIQPRVGYIEPGKRIDILIRFEPKIKTNDVLDNVKNLLRRQFETNKVNLQLELDAIQEVLNNSAEGEEETTRKMSEPENEITDDPFRDRKPSHDSSGKHRKSSNPKKHSLNSQNTPDHKKKHSLNTHENEEHGEKRRRRSSNKSHSKDLPAHASKDSISRKQSMAKLKRKASQLAIIKVTCLEDLALIYSNGKIDPADMTNLKLRRKKVMRALAAELEPVVKVPILKGSVDFERSRRDLLHNMKDQSQTHNIACVVTGPDMDISTLLVTIRCPFSRPDIILMEDNNICDFGPVALHHKSIKEVHVCNVSEKELKLKLDIPNPYGPFVRLNALRPLAPDNVFTLRFKFVPDDTGHHDEVVNIFSGESRISISLCGTGVNAEFNVFPEDKEVNLGITRPRDIIVYKFTIVNTSVLNLDFEIQAVQGGSFGTQEVVHVEKYAPRRRSTLSKRSSNPDDRRISHSKRRSQDRRTSGDLGQEHALDSLKIDIGEDSKHGEGPDEERRLSRDKRNSQDKRSSHGKRSSQDKRLSQDKNSSQDGKRSSKDKRSSQDGKHLSQDGKRRLSQDVKRQSRHGFLATPPKYPGTFEIVPSEPSPDAITELGFHHLLQTLSQNNLPYFMGPAKRHILVPGRETASFDMCFVPMESGEFSREFMIRLYDRMVHKFTVKGIADRDYVPPVEGEEEEYLGTFP